ncbi:hypothetical protein LEP1GSC050_0998 [Leptospira broomii serovar Hurstbridge str. 5399]|uniref:Uncharacterized protein n=1 Tax=Leptospira broomii serovar Hurstbridge str. 5399 TaxID=1049789 RepID=T0FGC2_9LEPT|nr:hypothetical protein LEP1GSC050_0998 [Leptospira broomii serovar Hurstbridge str. 5399]
MGNLFFRIGRVSSHLSPSRKGGENGILKIPRPTGRGPVWWKYALYNFPDVFATLFLASPRVGAPTEFSSSPKRKKLRSFVLSPQTVIRVELYDPNWSLFTGLIPSNLGWILCDIILLYSHYNLTL